MAKSVYNQEVRQLLLETLLLTGGVNNANYEYPEAHETKYGTASATNDVFTFRNVYLRGVVGEDWYRKYSTFGLRLRQISWDATQNRSYNFKDINSMRLCLAVRGLVWANHRPLFTPGDGTQYMINFTFDGARPDAKLLLAGDAAPIFPFKIEGDYADITLSYVQTGDYQSPPTLLEDPTFTKAEAMPTARFVFDVVAMPQPCRTSCPRASIKTR